MAKIKSNKKQKKEDKKNQKEVSKKNTLTGIKNETRQGILAITFFVAAIIFILASIKTGTPGNEVYYAGPVGKEVYYLLSKTFF
jgi:hypothetical protein